MLAARSIFGLLSERSSITNVGTSAVFLESKTTGSCEMEMGNAIILANRYALSVVVVR